MPVSRVAIEHALDAIASNEGGMGFQGLAVVLAKLRWPELIRCERKWDPGLDAHAPAILSPLHVGIRLSSSTTPELKKIRADATRAKPQLPEATARQEINACSRLQQDDGQLGALPDPGSVLTALCSHYVLERSTYPDITYTFLHQQFQESFAALHLKRNLSEMVTTGTGRTMLRDQRTARRPKP